MAALAVSLIVICLWIGVGIRVSDDRKRKFIGIAFAVFIMAVRSARYIMDIVYDRFDIFDVLSLHICHIDLILLSVCLIKPNRFLFSFNFLIGMPMGLAVALFPGNTHPAPGLLRAIFFIGSHMMLAGGAVYLAVVEKLKIKLKYLLILSAGGIAGTGIIYVVNKFVGTNYLYLMGAPEGTVIEKMETTFGYPGYVFLMIVIALAFMFLLYFLSRAISRKSYGSNDVA